MKKVNQELINRLFKELPQPPSELYQTGVPLETLLERTRIAIVGSRKVSPYGREVTARLAGDLAKCGIVVISGLALGVDSLAHLAALEAEGLTLAVMPQGLDKIYPASHYFLARRILENKGTLISEYPPGSTARKHHFIARNRLIAALSDGVLITEAAAKSGSLHTVQFALEQGIRVFAVPGNITSPQSVGTNDLIKQGAVPVTSYQDILHELELTQLVLGPLELKGSTKEETLLLQLIAQGKSETQDLQLASKLSVQAFNQALTMLEVNDQIKFLDGHRWVLNH